MSPDSSPLAHICLQADDRGGAQQHLQVCRRQKSELRSLSVESGINRGTK